MPLPDDLSMRTATLRDLRAIADLRLERDPWDGRMARGAPIPRREESIYGSTSGALG